MKKILLLAAICGLCTTFSATCQTPELFNKIAVCTSQDGINIRKSPSTSSPKAVYKWNDIDDYQVPICTFTYWATSTPSKNIGDADKFIGCGVIVNEQGDWLEIKGIGPQSSNGWVSAKYCNVVTPSPIDETYLKQNPNIYSYRKGGKVHIVYMDSNEMDACVTFYIGNLIDGKLYCTQQLFVPQLYIEPGVNKLVKQDGQYLLKLSDPEMGASSFNQELIMDIQRNAHTTDMAKVFYLTPEGWLSSVDWPKN